MQVWYKRKINGGRSKLINFQKEILKFRKGKEESDVIEKGWVSIEKIKEKEMYLIVYR